ncbi:MAG: hypothetical protein FJX75_11790 [Armatimonadetes bacterium]|nr:hypothetical protein [Armatimonadota bacterium]
MKRLSYLALCLTLAASAAAQDATALREWLICGAFPGLAGIAMQGPEAEAHLYPAEGDAVHLCPLDMVIDTRWRRFTSPEPRVALESEGAFKGHTDFGWPWGCAYASAYLSTPQPVRAKLRLATVYRLCAWVDGKPVASGDPVELGPKPRRLLLKVCAPRADEPQFGQGWWFEAGLATDDGGPVPGLQITLSDPDRAPGEIAPESGRSLGQLTELRVEPSRPRCTFLPSEEASLNLVFSVMSPETRKARFGVDCTDFDQAPNRRVFEWQAFDYDDAPLTQGSQPVAYSLASPATVPINLGLRPLGFYTIHGLLRNEAGQVVRRFDPVGIAVVRGPIAGGEVPRKLSSAFYWMSSVDWRGYIPWLSRIGLNRNLGLCASWWTEGYKPGTDYRPEFDQLLDLAAQHNVEFVGDLDAGWPAEMNPKLTLTPKQLFIWMWCPLPEWDSPEYESTVWRYAYNTVMRFKDHIRTWKSYNELDGTPMKPEVYAHVARLLTEEMRRADPEARFVGASFCRAADQLFTQLVDAGAIGYHDAVDVHTYPIPRFGFGADLDGWSKGGVDAYSEVLARKGLEKRFWWGEIGARRCFPFDGARGQCDSLIRMAAVGLSDPRVDVLAWCDPYAAHVDDYTLARPDGSAVPAVCAQSAVAHLLDGKRFVEVLPLPGLQAGKFAGAGEEVVVLWGDAEATFRVSGEAEIIDHIGRPSRPQVQDGAVVVRPRGGTLFLRAATVEAAGAR